MVRSFEVPAAPGWRCRLLPRRLAASALALLGLAACDRQPEPARPAAGSNGDGPPAAEQARVLGLTPWHADFPFEVALSPRRPGHWYDRSKRQALAQIVANLQGNCTQQAWHFARVFFNTAPAGAAELLADAAERNYTAQGLAPFMENLADAMACTRDESLAPVLLRLLDHPNSAVATSAATAMISCGTPDTLRDAEAKLAGATLRARCDWLRAVA